MKRKQIKEQAAQYAKFVEWSADDECFIGRCPEIMLGGIHGDDEAMVYVELCRAVEEMLSLIHSDGGKLPEARRGEQFSGNFVVRVDPDLHRRLVLKARAEGESLNRFVARKLARA